MSSESIPRAMLIPDDTALDVVDLTKVYRVYGRPHDRLKQALADRLGRKRSYCFEVPAVNGVSFQVKRGESVAVIGRNGSGKSTLLEMVTGNLAPTSGSVHTAGRISALLELGSGFNPDYTGRQNFRLSAAISGLTEDEIEAAEPEVLKFAEIGAFVDQPVRTYSSGMYVRLAFATSVHVHPDILIIDEALAVGDVFFQQKCMDFINGELSGTTRLLVTHDLASAARFADRVIVMDEGKIAFEGDAFEAIEAYTALSLSAVSGAPTGSLATRSDRAGKRGPRASGEPRSFDEPGPLPSAEPGPSLDIERSTNPDRFLVHSAWVHAQTDAGVRSSETAAVAGDTVTVEAEVSTFIEVPEPIFGYLIRDRTGHVLFGQNSIGSGIRLLPLDAARWRLSMTFEWPEVEQGDYSLVLGLGSGVHPLHHTIVGWAQGVVKITSVPKRSVHGSFNNDLSQVVVVRAST